MTDVKDCTLDPRVKLMHRHKFKVYQESKCQQKKLTVLDRTVRYYYI